MIPAYAVFSQPLFKFVERTVRHSRHRPKHFSKWVFRIVFRSLYVVIVGFLAICMPFFSSIVGLVGAIGFWPATVLYPVEVRALAVLHHARFKKIARGVRL